MKRLPDISLRVLISSATSKGWRDGTSITLVQIFILRVRASSAAAWISGAAGSEATSPPKAVVAENR
jgi:hypothetical protein